MEPRNAILGLILAAGCIAAQGAAYSPISHNPVNVKDRGAKGDGVTDDTAVFKSAMAAVAVSGGQITIPPGIYAVNLVITNTGLVLQGSGTTRSDNYLTAADTNAPVIQIGTSDGSIMPYGVQLKNINLQGRQLCQTGLKIRAGYRCSYTSLTAQGFLADSVLLDGQGGLNPITYQNFSDFVIEGGDVAGNAFRAVYDTSNVGWVTAIFLSGGSLSAEYGHCLDLDGVELGISHCWIQAGDDHGIILRKSGAYSPHIYGTGVYEEVTGGGIGLETANSTDKRVSVFVSGDKMQISGKMKSSDGTLMTISDISGSSSYHTQMLYPQISGLMGFPGTTNQSSESMAIGRDGSDLRVLSDGSIRLAVGSSNGVYAVSSTNTSIDSVLQNSSAAAHRALSGSALWDAVPSGGSFRVADSNYNAKVLVYDTATNSALSIDSDGARFAADIKFSGGAKVYSPYLSSPTIYYPVLSGALLMPDADTQIYSTAGRMFLESAASGFVFAVPVGGSFLVATDATNLLVLSDAGNLTINGALTVGSNTVFAASNGYSGSGTNFLVDNGKFTNGVPEVSVDTVTTTSMLFGTNVLSYSGTNLLWNGQTVTITP